MTNDNKVMKCGKCGSCLFFQGRFFPYKCLKGIVGSTDNDDNGCYAYQRK